MSIEFQRVTPILRIFDEAKAREFYVDFLGFKVDWEHRFGKNMPLYMQISRGNLVLHLSEHHGDASPGSTVSVKTTGVDEFHRELSAKKYKYNRPGVEITPWKTKTMGVWDPFRNHITFDEEIGDSSKPAKKKSRGTGGAIAKNKPAKTRK
jgi:hypothetical protein